MSTFLQKSHDHGPVRVVNKGITIEAKGENADKIADAAAAMLLMFGFAAIITALAKS